MRILLLQMQDFTYNTSMIFCSKTCCTNSTQCEWLRNSADARAVRSTLLSRVVSICTGSMQRHRLVEANWWNKKKKEKHHNTHQTSSTVVNNLMHSWFLPSRHLSDRNELGVHPQPWQRSQGCVDIETH